MLRFLSVFLMSVCFVFLVTSARAANRDVEVSEIATKITKEADRSGDLWFSIKATVKNIGQDSDVRVSLQAVDGEGFEIYDLMLTGNIPPGESATLSDKKYMPQADFNNIKDWRIAD